MRTTSERPIKFQSPKEEYYDILPSSILYAEADNVYAYIVCKDCRCHVRHPLAMLQELLPYYFIRIHRSFLVNSCCIYTIYPHSIRLKNGSNLPLPIRNRGHLIEYLSQQGHCLPL